MQKHPPGLHKFTCKSLCYEIPRFTTAIYWIRTTKYYCKLELEGSILSIIRNSSREKNELDSQLGKDLVTGRKQLQSRPSRRRRSRGRRRRRRRVERLSRSNCSAQRRPRRRLLGPSQSAFQSRRNHLALSREAVTGQRCQRRRSGGDGVMQSMRSAASAGSPYEKFFFKAAHFLFEELLEQARWAQQRMFSSAYNGPAQKQHWAIALPCQIILCTQMK